MAKIGRDRDNEPLRVGGQQTGLPLAIDELFGQIRLKGFNAAGQPVKLSAETTTGELRIMNTGWNGSAVTRVLLETTGEQKSVLYGKDSGANIDPLRTNADQQLQVEVVDGAGTASRKKLGGSEPAAATETTVYTVPASTETTIDKIVVANRGVATTFNLGVAVGGGSLSDDEHWFDTVSIAANTTLFIDGPFYLATTDLLRAESASGDVAFQAYGLEYA
jgi:hypothetical protein